ncbi:MAG: hypothetical protein HY913_24415 [Desulfomonile tiedjei]|nr:hypothetical protein [Desulfomonile tiedjei]
MNAAPSTQEKRSIKVKDFLADFRSGTGDETLLAKYHLTPVGLEKFYAMLVEREILRQDELTGRNAFPAPGRKSAGDAEKSSFICPACLAAHDTMFDICPCCGVSFQEMISSQSSADRPVAEQQDQDYFAGQKQQQADSKGDLFVSPPPSNRERPARLRSPAGNPLTADVREEDEFAHPYDWRKTNSQFEDPLDEIVCGMPVEDDYAYENKTPDQKTVTCDNCQGKASAALRDIYDRKRSLLSLGLCGVSLFLGLVGAIVITFFEGYSFARLLTLYFTGLFLMFGGVLCAVGSFMYLAREKVYYCAACGRVYPRG